MEALGAVAHVVVGLAGGVIALIVLTGPVQAGQLAVDVGTGGHRAFPRRDIRDPRERGAHHDHPLEHVRANEGAHRRHRRAEVVSDHGRRPIEAEGADQGECVAYCAQQSGSVCQSPS